MTRRRATRERIRRNRERRYFRWRRARSDYLYPRVTHVELVPVGTIAWGHA